jgi:hypothetical protein
MPTIFGDNSDGFANETEIINYINTKRMFDIMNNNMKGFLSFLFGQDLSDFNISASKLRGQVKPDIAITVNGITRNVSVKKGSGNSVHQEPLSTFETFLLSNHVPVETVTFLKEFHYGDGSTDGNGGTRVNAATWQANNPRKVINMNSVFNSPTLLRAVFDRVLFVGNVSPAPIVHAMYHGSINNGLWASSDEIIEYLINAINTASTIHFSNLTYQVWNRNLNHNPKTANRRHVMQFKWPSLTNDLMIISRQRR